MCLKSQPHLVRLLIKYSTANWFKLLTFHQLHCYLEIFLAAHDSMLVWSEQGLHNMTKPPIRSSLAPYCLQQKRFPSPPTPDSFMIRSMEMWDLCWFLCLVYVLHVILYRLWRFVIHKEHTNCEETTLTQRNRHLDSMLDCSLVIFIWNGSKTINSNKSFCLYNRCDSGNTTVLKISY